MSAIDISSNIAKEGDAVIIYEDFKTSTILKLNSQLSFDNRFGRFHHRDFIGKEFGSKVSAKNGYVYMLKPSPSLITQSLPHRTQILYSVDISVIILKLNIKPGSVVVESGTGSGSLSSSLATAVGPTGFLYTYEFNQDRAEKAQKEFENLGFKNIKVTWRDACKDGFLPKENEELNLKTCDAVFLDLPKPWEAIPHADKVLKKGGRICCFSPCIEQVQKSCLELASKKYIEIRIFECIGRTYERKKNTLKSFRFDQGENKKRRGQDLEEEKPIVKKEKLETPEEEGGKEPQDKIETQEVPEEQKESENNVEEKKEAQETTLPEKPVQQQPPKENQTSTHKKPQMPQGQQFYFTSGSQFSQGHTGYLTFAIKY